MKQIFFKSNEFCQSLAMANSVILSKNSLPILGDVRIETKDDGNGGVCAELTSSDSETWLQLVTPLESTTEIGIVFCIEAKALLQALRNLGGLPVTMELDDAKHVAVCKYSNGHFQLPYDDAVEFPLPTSVDDSDAIEKDIDAQKLLVAIEKSGFATANDELRPVMNGVHFDYFFDGMVAVASDGHKLAKYKDLTVTYAQKDDEPIPVAHGYTLPKKPCNILLNVLASTIAGDVRVHFNERIVVFSNQMFKLTSRLVEGRYPNYDSVIPKDNNIEINIDKASFIAALKRVLPMGNTSSELVSLAFSVGTMVISTEDIEFSKSASETVFCDFSSSPLSIGFKGSILLQLLQNIETNVVKLSLKDPSRAGVLSEDKQNDTYEYVSLIMPMLIN